jgi:hypothetical protein
MIKLFSLWWLIGGSSSEQGDTYGIKAEDWTLWVQGMTGMDDVYLRRCLGMADDLYLTIGLSAMLLSNRLMGSC